VGANRPAAPDALRDDLAGALSLIADQPTCGAPTASPACRGVRRIHLARIAELKTRVDALQGQVQALEERLDA